MGANTICVDAPAPLANSGSRTFNCVCVQGFYSDQFNFDPNTGLANSPPGANGCQACTPIPNATSVACTSATNSRALVCTMGFQCSGVCTASGSTVPPARAPHWT
jgi:hypothetical protein